MSGKIDPVAAAIDDARSFMDALLQGDWQELHIARGDFELFIAGEEGGANPMFADIEVYEPPVPTPATRTTAISAPHVATIVWVAEPGTNVAAGDPLARLSVLDEEEPMLADNAGQIVSVEIEPGQLVEFGMTILQIAQHT